MDCPKKPAISALILDIDGTLIDSNHAHAMSWASAFTQLGIATTYERVRELIGMGKDQLIPEITGLESDSRIGKKISAAKKMFFENDYINRLEPFPGSLLLLTALKECGIRLIAGSSAGEKELELLILRIGAEKLIEERVSSDDADRSKPAPDIVLAALERLQVAPGDALMLGDTPYDIEAAARARVETVALTCGGWHAKALLDSGALAVYRDPLDLWMNLAHSPLVHQEFHGVSPKGAIKTGRAA